MVIPVKDPTERIVTNTQEVDPMPVITGAMEYPADLVEKMESLGIAVDAMDCAFPWQIRQALPRRSNIVLMGRLSRYFDIPEEKWQQAITRVRAGKICGCESEGFCPGQRRGVRKKTIRRRKEMGNYYQPEIETMPLEQLQLLQSERLVEQVKHVYKNVEFYRNKMDEAGVKPEDIHGIEDLYKLPFITKDDLRDQYPYGLLGVPLSDCVRIQSTSGTTGRRVVAFYTQEDLDIWEECCARAIVAAGGTRDDVCHVCYGYGLFTGGPGLNGGSHKVGCLTLPMSSGNTERQLQFMTDLGSTIICCTPSYAANLAEAINERGIRDKIKLKAGIFGAEPWTEEMRHNIEEALGIKAYDIYGLTEISGPGVSFECEEQAGMHIQEEHFIPEIINPDTGEVLPEGEVGELVFTCITKKAFPLIRYRTRDLCYLTRKKCSCGRTHIRMHKPMGRSDDMMVIKGVNVFPSQIETVLLKRGYQANYQIIVDRKGNNDTCLVKVELTPEMAEDTIRSNEARERAGFQTQIHAGHPGGCEGGAAQVHRAKRGQGRPRHRQEKSVQQLRKEKEELPRQYGSFFFLFCRCLAVNAAPAFFYACGSGRHPVR